MNKTIDRNIQPPIKPIENILTPQANYIDYPNGLKAAFFEDEAHEVIKIELIFPAGIKYQTKNLLASSTLENMREGTASFSSEEINEAFDFSGTQFYISNSFEYSKIGILSLKKNIEADLNLLTEIILQPQFPQKELDIYLGKKRQSFIINKEKVVHLAKTAFFEHIMGEKHPYGRATQMADFDNISREDLIAFHKKHYQLAHCKMIVSGHIDKNIKALIAQSLGSLESTEGQKEETLEAPDFKAPNFSSETLIIEKKNALQAAVFMGKHMPMPQEPDFAKIKIFTSILGGYFGSRLMKNIREEKGYTYGIGASLSYLSDLCFLSISTEVKSEFSQATIDEINKELELLRSELVSREELDKVINYNKSVILQSLDGSFTSSNTFANHWLINNGWSQLEDYIEELKSISPEEIKEIANKYFKTGSFLTVVAG